jgi:hypothetical protein
MEKRGQVTIFIIIAIIIIVLGVLIYLFYPQIQSWISPESKNPGAFLQNCLEDEIENTIELISLRGGSMNPEHFVMNDNEPAEYLCYTNAYYETCVVQQPMLKTHIESEIKTEIAEEVDICLADLQNSFEDEGYDVSIQEGDVIVELLPERIVTTLTHKLTLTRADSERYDSFNIIQKNDLYDLVSIARNIINWEATYGQAPETVYMDLYHDLKVEIHKRDDGSKIYILTNRDSGNKFQFASRSLVMK